jgi:hypothetical protein
MADVAVTTQLTDYLNEPERTDRHELRWIDVNFPDERSYGTVGRYSEYSNSFSSKNTPFRYHLPFS